MVDTKARDFLFWAGQTMLLALCTAAVVHEVRLGKIEGNRFSDADASALELRIMAQLPHDWLREDIREIKTSVKEVGASVKENGERLRALEARKGN